MSPGDERSRPAGYGPATTSLTDDAGSIRSTRGARRYCPFVERVSRRRRISRDLDQLMRELYPAEPAEPSTFSLTDDELRRHANELHDAGWSVEEITTRLDVSPR